MAKPKRTRRKPAPPTDADSVFHGVFHNRVGALMNLEFSDGDGYWHAAALHPDEALALASKLIAFARRAHRDALRTLATAALKVSR